MKFEEIADMAYKNKELDEYVNLPIKYAYVKLKELYDNFKSGEISKEKCIPLKRKIEREYENNIAEYEKDMQVYKEYNNNRNINEDLLIKMQKATSKDEAFEFSLKILENCLNDSSLSRRILEKFQN